MFIYLVARCDFPLGCFMGGYKESFLSHPPLHCRSFSGLDGPLRGTLIGLRELSESNFPRANISVTLNCRLNTNALCGIYTHIYLIFTECKRKKQNTKQWGQPPSSWYRTNPNELLISLVNKRLLEYWRKDKSKSDTMINYDTHY